LTGRKAEEGLALSLLHFLGTDDDFFALAPAFVNQRSDNLLCRDQAFRLQTRALETPMEFVFWISGIRLPPIGRNSIAGVDHHQPPGIGNGKLLAIMSRIRMATTTIANFSKTKNWDGLIHGEPLARQFAFVILNQAP
jgi:hypothetical protein